MNYLRLRSDIPGFILYAYIDREEYLCDVIFGKYGICPIFRKAEFGHADFEGWRLVVCHVRKKHAEKVKRVFRDLEDKMLLLGYSEYPELCEKFQKHFEDRGKKDNER